MATTAEKQLITLLSIIAKCRSLVPDLPSVDAKALQVLLERPKLGVGAIVFSAAGDRILIGERRSQLGSGKWALPGGHLENSESWAECASRETEEETKILVHPSRWVHVSTTNDVMERDQAQGKSQDKHGGAGQAGAAGVGGAASEPVQPPLPPLHYVTIFMACKASEEEIRALCNVEPDKCSGWHWLEWAQVQALCDEGKLFLPLQHFLEQKGPEKAAALLSLATP